MPKRPKQHRLEDKSRVKFQEILPEMWVYRDKDKDYGIDSEIELFDKNEKAQGIVFYAQLKATESKKTSTILNVSFDIDTLRYYKKLEIPVLLVRYSEFNDSIYVKWIDNVDLFFAKKDAKTFRIKLSEENLWNSNSSEKIERRLKNIRKLKSGYFNFPIPYSINIKSQKVNNFSKAILTTQIKSALKEYSEFLINASEKDSIVEILLDNEELKISILDLYGCTFHSIGKRKLDEFSVGVAKDIMLGVATSFIQIGQIDHCGKIIFSNNLHRRLLNKKELLVQLLPPLFQSSYFKNTLNLIGDILDSESSFEIQILTAVNLLISSELNSKSKNRAIEKFYKKRLNKSIKKEDNTQTGISHYNLGNFYRGKGELFKSVKNYIAAKRYEPIYLQQDYYYQELAGVFFLMDRFKVASGLYAKSIELGAGGLTKALYADALMFSGSYEQAKVAFFEYLDSNENPSAEFYLKAISLETIIENTGIKQQSRKIFEAMAKADIKKISKNGNVDIEKELEKTLELDLLSGLTWFNLGITQIEKSQEDHALFSFIMAGLVQNNDIEAWKNAFLCSFKVKSQLYLLPSIIQTAYFFNGEEFVLQLYSHLEKTNGIEDITPFMAIVEMVLQKVEKDESPPTVRALNEKGKFENIFKK
ncbi:DUF4365 domain-containing protein [Labilibaculum sp. K2S]|uniref:DUF4365 domain-containing protein n=1 Tax=Labilibaculum sp. K2S TaxID=3056386 RepID=UPI0025A39DAA|nr:DUF4365 domain-containing protein [Labilibaculum sp. K2S]MDM8162232.1 DUF4365 domain-containing protein [Labilibaculum sp. K2S]